MTSPPPPVCMCNEPLESMTTFKLLGIIFSSDLTWGAHVNYLYRKCSRRLYLLIMLKRAGVPTRDILRIYLTMIRSVLEYACQVWHTSLSGAHSDKLESVQRRALHIVYPDLSYPKGLSQSGLSLLSNCREDLCRAFFKDMLSPSHRIHHLLPQNTPPPACAACFTLWPSQSGPIPKDSCALWSLPEDTCTLWTTALAMIYHNRIILKIHWRLLN